MPPPHPSPTAKLSAGDPALRNGPPENLPIEREAVDNRRYLRGSAWGALDWSGAFSVDAGGSNTVFTARVGIITGVTLCNGDGTSTGDWRNFFTAAEKQLHLSDVEGTPANLAGDSIYHAYVWNDGTTTLRWQLSTTPPTEAGAPTVCTGYKRGQVANYKYLGCFPTDSSGNPLALRASRGRYLYVTPSVLATVTASGLQSLASRVPQHARTALLRATVTRTSTTGNLLGNVRETSGGGVSEYGWGVVMLNVDVLTSVSGSFEIVPNASREVYVGAGGADSAVVLTAAGFTE